MRLEEEAEAEDGTLLMLMRELSVSVINIGGLTVKRWSFLALFFAPFVSLWVPTREAVRDVFFETRIAEEFDEEKRFRLVTRLACLVTDTDTGGLPLENGIEMKT